MTNPNIGNLVSQMWNEIIEETPDPFRNSMHYLYNHLTGIKGPTYQQRLDTIPVNFYGRPIPRIVTIRRNLQRLGNIRLDPKRLR